MAKNSDLRPEMESSESAEENATSQEVLPPDDLAAAALPSHLKNGLIHCHQKNGFALCRLPIPKPGGILGFIGPNNSGKTTAITILGGQVKPNLGIHINPPEWTDVFQKFQNLEFLHYFQGVLNLECKPLLKPQYIKLIPQRLPGTVQKYLDARVKKEEQEVICRYFGLEKFRNQELKTLSSGELQRFACAFVCVQEGRFYFFDEFSSHLDLKQKLRIASAIRSLRSAYKHIVIVDHDLAILDYLADGICCFYGHQNVYGVATKPLPVRLGINLFLSGSLLNKEFKFRDIAFFNKAVEEVKHKRNFEYPVMSKSFNNFRIDIKNGECFLSEIIVLLGENGSGKTTFLKLFAKQLQPEESSGDINVIVSYKVQKIWGKSECTVKNLLEEKIGDSYADEQFVADVMKPLKIFDIMNKEVVTLSGEELQRVALSVCLGTPADVYLIDEPSIYLDCEMRLIAAEVIKRFIISRKKTGFVAEHDFLMATYLADRVIVFEGEPSVKTTASPPISLVSGMNKYLKLLEATSRRDPDNFGFWFNKEGSFKDREQKRSGQYFFLHD